MVGSAAARTAAKLWYVKMLADQQTVPVPRDPQRSVSGAADPDRVLLIGNGPTHGWGTITHELALTGQLARVLTRSTGRPTDVETVGDELMSLATVLPWLGDRDLFGFDLVLVVLSMNDAVRLTPVEDYRAQMTALLGRLTAETKPSARIVVAGIHPVASLPHYRGVAARIGQRSADRLNASTRELVGRFDGVQYMDLAAPEPEADRPYGSPAMYAEWAEFFTATCAPALDAARALDTDRTPAVDEAREWAWEPGRHLVDGAPAEGWQGLDRIIVDAKDRFGADIAYVTVIDGDQQYFVATTGPNGRSVPLELTHCAVTVQGDDPVVVRNAMKDERFEGNPFIDVTQMRFYAGVPLKNEEGRNIGTFCVLSALPKSDRAVSEAQLLQYAARAQHELQRLAADSRSTAPARTEDTAHS